MIAPARRAAFDALHAVESGRADLPDALVRARDRLGDERDRALAGEIATGALRWQGAFDHVIGLFARRDACRLDEEVRIILRMGMFQLLHLDRVPASAIVDDAVEMTRAVGKASAAGFVNAVLRRVSRERDQLPLPARPSGGGDRDAAVAYLSITLSHPAWLAARWLDRCGFEAAEAWARFNNAPAPLTLRANTLRHAREEVAAALSAREIDTDPARFAPDGLVVRRGNPLLSDLVHRGSFIVQDEASQLVGAFAGARPGDRVLDTCAAPGGKTTQMAAGMRDRGLVVAADVRDRRVALLGRAVEAAGAARIQIVQADARQPLPFRAIFDLVLVDAPCSGLGTIRRDPDIRWRRREDDLPGFAAAQLELLDRAAGVVRPGGRLVYATCSSEPEENEAVVGAFLERTPDFEAATRTAFDGMPELSPLVDARRHLRTLPHRDGLEAFFAAGLVKAG